VQGADTKREQNTMTLKTFAVISTILGLGVSVGLVYVVIEFVVPLL